LVNIKTHTDIIITLSYTKCKACKMSSYKTDQRSGNVNCIVY